MIQFSATSIGNATGGVTGGAVQITNGTREETFAAIVNVAPLPSPGAVTIFMGDKFRASEVAA